MGLFDKQIARKPNHYPETQIWIDALHDGHWTVKEFDFRIDYSQFQQLDPVLQGIIVRSVSAIAQIEVAVKTFWGKLGERLPNPAIVDLGYVMANNEVIHNQAYEELLTVLGLERVFEENLKEPVIAGRVNYLQKHNEQNYADLRKQFIYAIILFTIFVENASLFSQFYTINYYHRFNNILPDTAQQLSYTVKEETIHAQVGIYLINKLRQEYPELFDDELEAKIVKEVSAAYEAESKVIDWIIGDTVETNRTIVLGEEIEVGLSAPILKAFIKARMNDAMLEIGFPGLELNEQEKLDYTKATWFETEINGVTTTDFFHKTPVEYTQGKQYNEEDIFA